VFGERDRNSAGEPVRITDRSGLSRTVDGGRERDTERRAE
jgi:hypothetical protein